MKNEQEKFMKLIAKVSSKMEDEKFYIKRINASNIPYKLYGKPLLKGNLFIIGNSKLLTKVRFNYKLNQSKFLKNNYMFKLNKFKKLTGKGRKGIIFLFNDDYESNQFVFKKVVGVNNNNYAYLDAACDIYNNHTDNNYEKHIQTYLCSPDYLSTSKNKTKKKLLKTLNN